VIPFRREATVTLGVARQATRYNERGNQIEVAYFDEGGKPVRDIDDDWSSAAIQVYKAARIINRDACVVGRVLRLISSLAVADSAKKLNRVTQNTRGWRPTPPATRYPRGACRKPRNS
jgi:hypothetical protein